MTIKTASGNGRGRVFGLISGPPGSGKTTQMTTFPKNKTLGVSIEDGFLSIDGSGYAYEEIDSYDDLLDLVTNIRKKHPWVEYLYIDSLTEIYDILKHELKGKFNAKQNYAKHEEMYDKMLHIVRVARRLDISVFFTCHTKEEKDGMSLIQKLAFDGKMPELVMKQFDVCIHLDRIEVDGKTTRAFITTPMISKVAKVRVSPWLNIKVNDYEEPNLYKLTQKLMGKKGE